MTSKRPDSLDSLVQARVVGYRADIDGLRGVAVVAVLAFHAFPSIARSGFVGVDVFFVISGFLISGIILSEISQGRFTYRAFYARRIKRIFPALATVLAATVALGWALLLPDEFKSLGEQVFGGAAFVANLVLWHQSGYFDQDASLKPLLHLWSLGIEEQFYLVWPAALAIALSVRRPIALVVAGLLASFAANILFVSGHPDATFYLPISRMWELLVGAAITLSGPHFLDNAKAAFGKRAPSVAQIIGAFALLLGLLTIKDNAAFPGWWALLPTLGTALLIVAGPSGWVSQQILSRRPLVFVGLISYPLYLWHWPLLAYDHILYGTQSAPIVRIALIVASFVLATLTYWAIEKPIRVGRLIAWPAVLATALGIAAVTGGLMARGVLGPVSAGVQFQPIWAAVADWQPFSKPVSEESFRSITLRTVAAAAPTRVLFFGDSNMEQLGPRIEAVLNADPTRRVGAVMTAIGGCPPIPNVLERHHPDCPTFVADSIKLASESSIDRIVVGACWACYFRQDTGAFNQRSSYYYDDHSIQQLLGESSAGNELAFASLKRMLTEFAALKPTYLVLNVPFGTNANPKAIVHRSVLGISLTRRVLARAAVLEQYENVRTRLTEIGREAGATVIDPFDLLCPEAVCPTFTATGEPIYKDTTHLRPFYIRERGGFIDETIAAVAPPHVIASTNQVD